MTEDQIRAQSNAALKQWGEQWEKHCKIHSKDKDVKNNLIDLESSGIGKAVLLVANGYSLEENMDKIKDNQETCDIICCDKSLGHLLRNEVYPKYCLVCDANVNFEKYLKPYLDKLDKTILLINVCANPEWSQVVNWKSKYFFVNKDIIKSEINFSKISGCNNFIPTGTNVSNAMMIMLTQSDNNGKRNFFGYDKFLLIGYDYSWHVNGNYYAYDKDGNGKADYMKHIYCLNMNGDFAYTSGNLYFSSRWLEKYLSVYKFPVINCSKKTILNQTKFGDLNEQMKYNFKQEDSSRVKNMIEELKRIIKIKTDIDHELKNIEKEHFHSVLSSI